MCKQKSSLRSGVIEDKKKTKTGSLPSVITKSFYNPTKLAQVHMSHLNAECKLRLVQNVSGEQRIKRVGHRELAH